MGSRVGGSCKSGHGAGRGGACAIKSCCGVINLFLIEVASGKILSFLYYNISSAYRTVAGVNGPLVILDQVKVCLNLN